MSLTYDESETSIPIAVDSDEFVIFYDPKVPIRDRVKTLTAKRSLTALPYIDLDHNQRSATFISGSSGSGKSTAAVKIIRQIRKLRKDRKRKIAVFSTTIIEDPAYSRLKHVDFVSMEDPRFMELQVTELADRIVVFDDHENIKDPRLRNYCMSFVKDVLERTRKLGVDVIVINHMTMDYQRTKNLIFECDTYYINIAQNRNSSAKFLKSYADLSVPAIQELITHEYENPYDFVIYHKSAPPYLIVEREIKLL